MKIFYSLFCFAITGLSLTAQTFTKVNNSQINNDRGSWRSVSTVDINNDYKLDLIFGQGSGGRNSLYHNIWKGFKQENSNTLISQSSASGAPYFADFDNDCDLDVFWASIGGANNLLMTNNKGTFTLASSSTIYNNKKDAVGGAWLDLDNDGNLDLLIPHWQGIGSNFIFTQDTSSNLVKVDTGDFADSTTGRVWNVALADYDNDGDMDVFLANRNGSNYFLINDNGRLEWQNNSKLSQSKFGVSASWGDYNKDGFMDLYIARNNRKNLLYKNNGDSTFSQITAGSMVNDSYNSQGTYWGDLDNDGDLDLYVTHTGSFKRNLIYRNDGGNTFKKITSGNIYNELESTEGGMLADFNNDGFLDILNANRFSKPVTLFTNDGNGNNFIKLRVYGNASNRMGIGTRIEVKSSSEGWQYRELNASGSYRSTGPYELHFGLGSDSIIDSLVVLFPSGNNCVFRNVSAKTSYNIEEGVCTIDPYTEAKVQDSISFKTVMLSSDSSIGAITSYHWDFGDGDTSNLKNPTHTYKNSGIYNVCLTTYDSYCKWDSTCIAIKICDTLRPQFAYQGNGLQVSFTDSSNADSLQYLFGDGNSDTARNPTHTYAQAGVYTVCQIASDFCGSDTLCQTIRVCMDTTQSAFTTTINANLVNFNSGPSQNASQFFWDFGDGNTSVQPNPSHIYAANGTFTACLVVINDCFSDTSCQTINVCPYNPGQANFSAGKLAIPNAVKFTDLSVNATSYSWDFGDGGSSTNKNPTHVFPREDDYNVCLTIIDSCGNSDSTCQIVNPATVGIEELALQDWKIYPNPVSDLLHVETADRYNSLTVQIVSITGQKVLEHTFTQVERQEPLTLSLRHLPKGAYLVRFSTQGEALPLQRIVLKK